jgi:spore coat polysaccharide biosynthesis protein SpsF (cytidylyltransferase family)
MTVTAVVQARLGSSRLPGKVLANLAGKPMIDQITDRLRRTQSVTSVVWSTSDAASDDALVEHARDVGVLCVRAPVDDIIGRILAGARAAPSDFVLRVWGDCPFIDPATIDDMVRRAETEHLDFIHNSVPTERTYPAGLDVEIYRRSLLDRMDGEVTDPYLREFPFRFVETADAPNQAPLRRALHRLSDRRGDWYLTVDYPEDLIAANRLYARFDSPAFSLAELIDAGDRDPSLVDAFAGRARNADYFKKTEQRSS